MAKARQGYKTVEVECQPCGLHVSSQGNSQAHRRGCSLLRRPWHASRPSNPPRNDRGPPPIQTTPSVEARMNVV